MALALDPVGSAVGGLVTLSRRDRAILARTVALLSGGDPSFEDAVDAIGDAVASAIPNGRVYVLGREPSLVVGSLVSGVGITARADGVYVVRIDPRRGTRVLGSLRRWR